MAYTSFAALLAAASGGTAVAESGTVAEAANRGIAVDSAPSLDYSLAAAALARECFESGEEPSALRERMTGHVTVMREAIARGLSGEARSRSGLVGGDAKKLAESSAGPVGGLFSRAVAAALAVAENNAAMGRIVAAPTGGASGVLPGVLLTLAEDQGSSEDEIVDALFVASAFGAVMAARTNLSGAAAGCQAEIGAAAAMAAGAGVSLLGGTPTQSGHAASLALQGQLGLVCDPVAGLVEVPCVARNATAAAVALSAIEMAFAGVEFPLPFDDVADALASVGRALPSALRETAMGGLAVTQSGRRIAEDLAG